MPPMDLPQQPWWWLIVRIQCNPTTTNPKPQAHNLSHCPVQPANAPTRNLETPSTTEPSASITHNQPMLPMPHDRPMLPMPHSWCCIVWVCQTTTSEPPCLCMSDLVTPTSPPPAIPSHDHQQHHAPHPTGGQIMHLNIWWKNRRSGTMSWQEKPSLLSASATPNDAKTPHYTPAHHCNTSSHQLFNKSISIIPFPLKQNDTVLGAQMPSSSGTASNGSSVCSLSQASNKLSTHNLTYHMLTTHYYKPTVPGSTWHHRICNNSQKCMNVRTVTQILQYCTNKMKQEGNTHSTEPSCSTFTWPLTYNYHPVLPKNCHTVPTDSLGGEPTNAPTMHNCPFHAANHTIAYGNHLVYDDDYTAVLTGIPWYQPVAASRPDHFCLMPAHLQYSNHPYRCILHMIHGSYMTHVAFPLPTTADKNLLRPP